MIITAITGCEGEAVPILADAIMNKLHKEPEMMFEMNLFDSDGKLTSVEDLYTVLYKINEFSNFNIMIDHFDLISKAYPRFVEELLENPSVTKFYLVSNSPTGLPDNVVRKINYFFPQWFLYKEGKAEVLRNINAASGQRHDNKTLEWIVANTPLWNRDELKELLKLDAQNISLKVDQTKIDLPLRIQQWIEWVDFYSLNQKKITRDFLLTATDAYEELKSLKQTLKKQS